MDETWVNWKRFLNIWVTREVGTEEKNKIALTLKHSQMKYLILIVSLQKQEVGLAECSGGFSLEPGEGLQYFGKRVGDLLWRSNISRMMYPWLQVKFNKTIPCFRCKMGLLIVLQGVLGKKYLDTGFRKSIGHYFNPTWTSQTLYGMRWRQI